MSCCCSGTLSFDCIDDVYLLVVNFFASRCSIAVRHRQDHHYMNTAPSQGNLILLSERDASRWKHQVKYLMLILHWMNHYYIYALVRQLRFVAFYKPCYCHAWIFLMNVLLGHCCQVLVVRLVTRVMSGLRMLVMNLIELKTPVMN